MIRPSIALFDWDGTLYPEFIVVPWSEYLAWNELIDMRVCQSIKGFIASFCTKTIGYKELCEKVATAYAEGIAGKQQSSLAEAAQHFAALYGRHVYPYTRGVLRHLQSAGIATYVISGAPSCLLAAFAAQLGIDEVFALEVGTDVDGRFTKFVRRNCGLAEEKAKIVRTLAATHRVTFAFGNGPADEPLLDVAEVCFLLNCPRSRISKPLQSRVIEVTPDSERSILETLQGSR